MALIFFVFVFVFSNLGWLHNENRQKRGSDSLSKYVSGTNTNLRKKNHLSAIYALD